MTSRRTALIAAVATALCAMPLLAQTPWHEVKGAGFTLRSPISADTLAGTACDLEVAARVLRRSALESAVPQVVAIRDSRGIREWLPQSEGQRANPLGAYWQGPHGHHIVVRVDAQPDERRRRIFHEYAHYTTHLLHPEPPRWLDEGLSELWEHIVITSASIELGRQVPTHVKRLRTGRGWIPVDELVSQTSVPSGDGAVTAMFYAQSWALVHYLLLERQGGRVVLDRLPSAADLPSDEVLRDYVSGRMAKSVQIAVPRGGSGCARHLTIGRLSTLDSIIQRAQALADGERPDAALPLIHQALLLDPGNTQSLEVLGFVHFAGNRPIEAAAIFDRLIGAGQGSHIAYYYRAVLAGPVPERADGAGPVPQVEYLRKAVSLNPAFAPALELLKELSGKGLALATPQGL